MKKHDFSQLINVNVLNKMVVNLYEATGIPVGIVDSDGQIIISVGWQDICSKFHRQNPTTLQRCSNSDKYVKGNLKDGRYIQYKCMNNLWDIGVPIVIAGEHLATIFFGQYFFEDEEIDIDFFRSQAHRFGFNEKDYIDALMKVPRFSREEVFHIAEYYSGLVMTLAESGLSKLQYEEYKEELEKNHKYLKTILNSVNDPILIQDINGDIEDVNEAACSMFGYQLDEIIHENINKIAIMNSDNTRFNIKEVVKKARKINPLIMEFVVKNKNNNEFWVEANTLITDIDGDEKILSTVRDITDRKKADLVLQNEAKEMEKLRTEFFANVSHELRTPLSIILSSIQIVKMHLNNEEKELDRVKVFKSLNSQKQNCYRLLRLVNNLIDSTKLDSGNFEINMKNYNIVNIIEQITSSIADYVNNNSLSLTFDTDIEEKIIACDPNIIERIIFNLLSNSIKFTEHGGSIFVNIYDGEDFIKVSVRDTGIGIPKEKINVIFDRFAQVDKSFTRKNEGSGIGLSLVKSLVEMQGGTVSVQSKCGVGTRFDILLPVAVLEDDKDTNLISKTINNYVDTMSLEFSDIYR